MRRSTQTGKPVRVLRSGSSVGKHRYAPRVGLRYVGLCRVVDEEQSTNLKGRAYLRIELVRIARQPSVDLARPTLDEVAFFERVKDGY